MLAPNIGFIGAGRMATALASGFLSGKLVSPDTLLASDPSPQARLAFQRVVPGVEVVADNSPVVAWADVLWLAVKPQLMKDVLADLRGSLSSKTLVVSIAAGVTIERLTAGLPTGQRIIRVMPNTPCLIGRGASAFSIADCATRQDAELIGRLLRAVGAAFEVPESQLDAVTGLSGSGPAFVYTMIESLTEGGIAVGLPAELAAELAVRTAVGAAEMVLQTGETPAALRERVTSPGGTTLAGLTALDQGEFAAAVISAVTAATRRSAELGQATT